MNDLQCPATVVLATHSLLVSGANASSLGITRCSGVFVAAALAADAGDLARATGLARQAGCRLEILDEAVDATTLTIAVDGLADLYRGETLLVIAPDDVLREMYGTTQAIAVSIDSSGWIVANR